MKKDFKGGLNTLLSETSETKEKDNEKKQAIHPTLADEVKKTYERATIIINKSQHESIKALAYADRISQKDILEMAIDDYLIKRKADVLKANAIYLNKGKNENT